ncbi:MAG: homoserine kinase [Acidobacteriota bacterium]
MSLAPGGPPSRSGEPPSPGVPLGRWIRVFSPASIANLGPGFDALGVAVEGLGDTIEARRIEGADRPVAIAGLSGESEGIPADAARNCAGRSAEAVLQRIGVARGSGGGMEMRIHKGMPRGSGLGSSAASAVGGAVAARILYGADLGPERLLEAALEGEAIADGGRHADNLAPSLLGGFTIVRSLDPVEVVRLEAPPRLRFVLVLPRMEIQTRYARSILPEAVPLADAVSNWAHVGALVAAIAREDLPAMGRALVDRVVEPVRAKLIPGFLEARRAAMRAGAYGCSISGAGPTVFALAADQDAARIGRAMQAAFHGHGLASRRFVCPPDNRGARRIG